MKSKQLKLARREEKRRTKTVSVRARKITALVCAVVFVIALALFSADLIRVKRRNQPPIFCVPFIEYDNGSADYYGLFYKVWKDYNPFEDETRYYMGFWFIPKAFNL